MLKFGSNNLQKVTLPVSPICKHTVSYPFSWSRFLFTLLSFSVGSGLCVSLENSTLQTRRVLGIQGNHTAASSLSLRPFPLVSWIKFMTNDLEATARLVYQSALVNLSHRPLGYVVQMPQGPLISSAVRTTCPSGLRQRSGKRRRVRVKALWSSNFFFTGFVLLLRRRRLPG